MPFSPTAGDCLSIGTSRPPWHCVPRTIVCLASEPYPPTFVGMQPEIHTLAQLVATSGLIGSTIEYAEILKRRTAARRVAAEREEGAEIGLRGLVRVLLVDEPEQGSAPIT
jgi:hypothetical protein